MRSLYPLFSCDTVVATGAATRDGTTIFGKNSDREPNEAHHIVYVPPAVHPKDSKVNLTYIDVPQVEHTHGVLLAKPFWIWGAEMGVNDKGVAIGNEAVFTKAPYGKKPGLIGMDFLRLALERSRSAEEAVNVITALLERYGQSGNCGYQHKFYYHNSFIIADSTQAFVLETADRQWAVKKINGIYAISNGLTIENDWDMASKDLVAYAVHKNWCKNRKKFSFRTCYSDLLYTHFSDCRKRREQSMQRLAARKGKIDIGVFTSILRNHGDRTPFKPDRGLAGASVCMHAGPGPIRGSQTVGSFISHLHPETPTHFVTGTAAPCTSTFKPVWIDAALPDFGPAPTGINDQQTLYWRHEKLHRSMLRDISVLNDYQKERDDLENKIIADALTHATDEAHRKAGYSQKCFLLADEFELKWAKKTTNNTPGRISFLYHNAWKKWDRNAEMSIEV